MPLLAAVPEPGGDDGPSNGMACCQPSRAYRSGARGFSRVGFSSLAVGGLKMVGMEASPGVRTGQVAGDGALGLRLWFG